jgi:hypothetical protein
VDAKAIRMIVIFGVLGTLILTVMMMFTLDQATDTHMPQIAADIAAEFQPALAQEPPPAVRLAVTRDAGPPQRRVYTLQLRPSAAVAGAKASLSTLMYDASKLCALEIGELPGEVRVHCVAELPGGGSEEKTYLRDEHAFDTGIDVIHEVASAAAPGTPKR